MSKPQKEQHVALDRAEGPLSWRQQTRAWLLKHERPDQTGKRVLRWIWAFWNRDTPQRGHVAWNRSWPRYNHLHSDDNVILFFFNPHRENLFVWPLSTLGSQGQFQLPGIPSLARRFFVLTLSCFRFLRIANTKYSLSSAESLLRVLTYLIGSMTKISAITCEPKVTSTGHRW